MLRTDSFCLGTCRLLHCLEVLSSSSAEHMISGYLLSAEIWLLFAWTQHPRERDHLPAARRFYNLLLHALTPIRMGQGSILWRSPGTSCWYSLVFHTSPSLVPCLDDCRELDLAIASPALLIICMNADWSTSGKQLNCPTHTRLSVSSQRKKC